MRRLKLLMILTGLVFCIFSSIVPAKEKEDKQKVRALIVTGQDYPGHKWRLTTPGAYVGSLMNGLSRVDNRGLGGSDDWQIVGLPDFDADGDSDLLWRRSSTGAYVGSLMEGLSRVQDRGLGGSDDWKIMNLGGPRGLL